MAEVQWARDGYCCHVAPAESCFGYCQFTQHLNEIFKMAPSSSLSSGHAPCSLLRIAIRRVNGDLGKSKQEPEP